MEGQFEEYAKELRTIIDKSNEYFEKQLNYISAGTFGISMIIVEKLVKDLTNSSCKWLLFLSWSFLGATLISNLISHIFTSKMHAKTLNEIKEDQYKFESAVRRNKKINR
jgi:hypothetical protein